MANIPNPPPRQFVPVKHRDPQPQPQQVRQVSPPRDPTTASLEAAAKQGFGALTQLLEERDHAMENHRIAHEELTQVKARCRAVEDQLTDTTAKLEHYQRLCTSLLTRLNDIGSVIDSAIAEARDESAKGTTAGIDMTNQEGERMADLQRRMADGAAPLQTRPAERLLP
jgi:chromosome segregation ATPase